mgnify:CR=1 FL=1
MSLREHIAARIRAEGPMRLDHYFGTCLLHPQWGYYTGRDPFGTTGDFTTAPEISQMFGELIGLSLAQKWLEDGAPAPFTLAELGPGRGTLMADILRACAGVPGFVQAADIHLVEASPTLQKVQAATLNASTVTWITQAADLPDRPLYLVANEFLCATAGNGANGRWGCLRAHLCLALAPRSRSPCSRRVWTIQKTAI